MLAMSIQSFEKKHNYNYVTNELLIQDKYGTSRGKKQKTSLTESIGSKISIFGAP